ncbi:legumain [Acrasis kona]|uniref:legumain n=1 Tax=Acrasis kona TaxID=1008807 RepID=A0AAW2ZRT3_9EUKA
MGRHTLAFVIAAMMIIKLAHADNWAVLVSGSDGYYNYRHQADVCHTYHLLKNNGYKESNIIVFMKDDIAYNTENPFPGTIINYPGGPNVYEGVKMDYTGKDVTPTNFLNVLLGKDMSGIGTGKTLKTSSEDRVFVYFSDHGAPGLIAFPDYVMLYSKDLIETLDRMSSDNHFKEMVFYLEACESGSMFDRVLSDKLRIYATTAANPTESSYACDYDETYKAYLNDCYTRSFLNDTSNNDLHSQTLQDQFLRIKKSSTHSNVCQYGDMSIAKQPLSNWFLGTANKASNDLVFSSPPLTNFHLQKTKGLVNRNVKLEFLLKKIETATDSADKIKWQLELDDYKRDESKADTVFAAMSSMFELHYVRDAAANNGANDGDKCHTEVLDHDCIKEAAMVYQSECGKFNEYSIRYATYLNDACKARVSVNQLQKQLNRICSVVV